MRKKYECVIYYVLLPVIIASIILALLFGGAMMYPQNVFISSYQSVIQDKYDKLINTDEKKIILIGGSNLGFGINEELLSEKTGYAVVNMGLHAGFGGLFNTEVAKANINKGDIVLLGYEYGWHEDGYFDKFGVDLVMTGVESKIEMYKYVPLSKWEEMIGYLPEFIKKKATYSPVTGVYSRDSFNAEGYMILNREFALYQYEERIDYYKYVSLDDAVIAESSVLYLKEFKEYVEQNGASVYFIAPPLFENAKKSDDDTFLKLIELEEKEIGIQYISNPINYIFPAEYIYDTIYHCSSLGEIRRTELLSLDLYESGVLNIE